MNFLKIFFIVFFTITTALPVNAQQIWNGSTYGMSKDEVKKMFPKSSPAKSKKPLGSGVQPVYDLNEIDLEGHKFVATFFFRSDKLVQVNLSPQESESIDWILWKTNRLEEIITHKYGKPYESKGTLEKNNPSWKYKDISWKSGKVEILIKAWGTEKEAYLVIAYIADFFDAASKL